MVSPPSTLRLLSQSHFHKSHIVLVVRLLLVFIPIKSSAILVWHLKDYTAVFAEYYGSPPVSITVLSIEDSHRHLVSSSVRTSFNCDITKLSTTRINCTRLTLDYPDKWNLAIHHWDKNTVCRNQLYSQRFPVISKYSCWLWNHSNT